MRIVICDDDASATEQIASLVSGYFASVHLKCPEIVVFTDGAALLADPGAMDIVFLDIEMPGTNGIYVGQELTHRNRRTIIFVVTSYLEYLDDAMRFHVFRYLSKPLDRQRFYRNMNDALALYHIVSATVTVETKQDVHSVPADSVVMVETTGRKVTVHTVAAAYDSVHSLQHWLKALPSNTFFQTHRSYLVNFAYVTAFNRTTVRLGAIDKSAYLTKRRYSAFKNAYLLYLESTR